MLLRAFDFSELRGTAPCPYLNVPERVFGRYTAQRAVGKIITTLTLPIEVNCEIYEVGGPLIRGVALSRRRSASTKAL